MTRNEHTQTRTVRTTHSKHVTYRHGVTSHKTITAATPANQQHRRHKPVTRPATRVHFLDVQQGNMVLIQCTDGTNIIVDCHITDDNHDSVMSYLRKCEVNRVNVFCATHRDADHITGTKKLEARFSFNEIWDSGYTRDDETDLPDAYTEYVTLWSRYKPQRKTRVLNAGNRLEYGRTIIACVSSRDSAKPGTVNDQGLVLAVRDRYTHGTVLLTGDISRTGWDAGNIEQRLKGETVVVLMASHHGSNSFFELEGPDNEWDDKHLAALKPQKTIVSVGENSHGHPDSEAMRAYERYSRVVFRTDLEGHISLQPQSGTWKRVWL